MEKHLYICDECKKEIERQERYPVCFDTLSGWIKFNGIIEYDYNHRILTGEFDFCSKECLLKHLNDQPESK